MATKKLRVGSIVLVSHVAGTYSGVVYAIYPKTYQGTEFNIGVTCLKCSRGSYKPGTVYATNENEIERLF